MAINTLGGFCQFYDIADVSCDFDPYLRNLDCKKTNFFVYCLTCDSLFDLPNDLHFMMLIVEKNFLFNLGKVWEKNCCWNHFLRNIF